MSVSDDDQSRKIQESLGKRNEADRPSESRPRDSAEVETPAPFDEDNDFIGIRSVGASPIDDSDEPEEVAPGEEDGSPGLRSIDASALRKDSERVPLSPIMTRTVLQSDKPLRNRLFGRDFSVADSMFPDELEPKVRNQVYPVTEGDLWHLRRLEQKTRYYRRSLPVGIGLLAAIALVGVIFFNFGPIQLLAFFAGIYWMLGLYLKSGAVRTLLGIYMDDIQREPTNDPER